MPVISFVTPMKKTLLVCSLAILPPASAVEISVGGTQLSIPAPAGFAAVTGEMKPYADLSKRFVPATNEQFALFLPSADVAIAAGGGMPTPERRCYVQAERSIISLFVTAADFAELKQMIKTQNEELVKKAGAEMPEILQKLSQGLSDDFKVNVNLAVNQVLPLPPHYESERSLSYSMLVRYDVTDGTGKPSAYEGFVTATFVHLKGKVLFLYVNAEKAGLAWSRAEARKWAETVIAANPSVGEVAVRENTQRRTGFDWNRVALMAVIGGIIGGIVGLVNKLFKKRSG